MLSALVVLAAPGIGYAAPPPVPDETALPHDAAPAADTPTSIRTAQIVALIEGTLDPSVDASGLFVVDLANPSLGDGGQRLVSLLARLGAPVDPDPADERPATEWLAYQSAVLAYLQLAPEVRAEQLAT
ncbi:MAG: hypothetical protein JKY37_06945, partial [Nannocystaceae bacterium]|nr:hypothetical protein [Nannocystaceae bacterium]